MRIASAVTVFLLLAPWGCASLPVDVRKAHSRLVAMREDYRRGDLRGTVEEGRAAESLFAPGAASKEREEILATLAFSYEELGHFVEAEEALVRLEEEARRLGDPGSLASALEKRAALLLQVNRLDEAKAVIDAALEAAPAADCPGARAAGLNTRGNLRLLEKSPLTAAEDYEKSFALAAENGLVLLASRAAANAARAYLQLGRADDAKSSLRRSVESARRAPDSHEKAVTLANAGRMFGILAGRASGEDAAGVLLEAEGVVGEALDLAGRLGDRRALAYASGYLGAVLEAKGEMERALSLTRRASMESQSLGAPEALYLWQWQAGRILGALGEGDNALTAYRNAVATLQSIRQEVTGECRVSNQMDFKEVVEPVYVGLLDLLLNREGGEGLLLEALQVVEMMKTAELQDYLLNTCVEAKKKEIGRKELQVAETAVVYYVLFDERLEIIVSLPDAIKRYTVPTAREALALQAGGFRALLEGEGPGDLLRSGQKLYDRLVAPFAGELPARGIRTVVFVPDGPIRTIPLAALSDGGRFFVSDYAVVTVPALALTDTARVVGKKPSILLLGLSEARAGFPALEFVPRELESIREIFGGSVYLNESFSSETMRHELEERPYNIVHIASHAEISANALETYLLTWDGKVTMDQLEEFVRLSRYRREPLDLLSLSACKTAAENERAALGLAGLAVKAGAKSALATLWPIVDVSSSELVSEFYRQLRKPDVSKARALQLAQLSLLESEHYRHPLFWSPFLLIGSWM